MGEPLKLQFGSDVPRRIAAMVSAVHPAFDGRAFARRACAGDFEALNLFGRAWQIADALKAFLPAAYPEAADVLVRSLGPRSANGAGNGMAPFVYLPHVFFVARYGLEHFEPSMRAQYELTRRFTAEFSIRAYLLRHRDATLARLARWTEDPDAHVRRLVSEGTRPRLPWAIRLPEFQRDPRPVLALLERLRDDPAPYVRRSVANNLNDIGRDNPALLLETAGRWLRDASDDRRWIVTRALRSLVKQGDARALALLGYSGGSSLAVGGVSLRPRSPRIGEAIEIAFEVENRGRKRQAAIVDLRVHFVKANGRTAPKVFKARAIDLAPGEAAPVRLKVGLAQLTTRRHYPGRHVVEAVVNGRVEALGAFTLRPGG